MRWVILVTLLTSLSPPLASASEWSTSDMALAGAFLTLHWIDRQQTIQAMESGSFDELNPLLGSRPNKTEINAFFIASTALAFLLFDSADSKTPVIVLFLAVKSAAVAHNHSLGLSITF